MDQVSHAQRDVCFQKAVRAITGLSGPAGQAHCSGMLAPAGPAAAEYSMQPLRCSPARQQFARACQPDKRPPATQS